MDATPISFDTAAPLSAPPLAPGARAADDLGSRWAGLHDAAAVVAALAGVADATSLAGLRGFPAAVIQTHGWRRELAEQGVEDLAAIVAPGLEALLAVQAHGGDIAAPARALWQEFAIARDAVMGLVLPND